MSRRGSQARAGGGMAEKGGKSQEWLTSRWSRQRRARGSAAAFQEPNEHGRSDSSYHRRPMLSATLSPPPGNAAVAPWYGSINLVLGTTRDRGRDI